MNTMLKSAVLIGLLSLSKGTIAADKEDNTVVDKEGRVHITWQDPDSYRDIRKANRTRAAFRRHLYGEFDGIFEELAEALPEGYSLNVVVTDLDLAGQVWLNNGIFIRVVDRAFFPRIKFDYQLLDASQAPVQAEQVNLTHTRFLDTRLSRELDRPFAYEKKMLETWYDDTIAIKFATAKQN